MIVRPAYERELPAIERVYAAAIDAMRNTPYDILWEMGVHPTSERLLNAAQAGNLLVALDDAAAPDVADNTGDPSPAAAQKVRGALILDSNQADDYRMVPWHVEATPDAVQVIHLLAVDPVARGKGVGRALMAGAVDAARNRGAQTIRLDVFDNNAPAYCLYRACGFGDRGVFTMDLGDGVTHAAHLMEFDLRIQGSAAGTAAR